MKRLLILFSLVIGSFFMYSLVKKGTQKNKVLILKATEDFTISNTPEFVPAYHDKPNNSLAINAAAYKDKSSKAEYKYTGSKGYFDIEFTSLTESDGESSYKIIVDGLEVAEFKNPENSLDYTTKIHKASKILLKKNSIISVVFNTHSNQKIPEKNSFAYARGRWQQLKLSPLR